jgi:nickel superoxide dismutase
MKKLIFIFLTGLLPFLFFLSNADAHCEIPCGIYDDELRTKLIAEHATTIEKSMKQIMDLSKANSADYNQLSRWVSNKEAHATKIQDIISQYFMTQRIKPDQKKYVEKLTVLHKMLIAAMKCKQTTDFSHVDALRSHLKNFEVLYFGQSNH